MKYFLTLFLLAAFLFPALSPSSTVAEQLSRQEYTVLNKIYTLIEEEQFEAGLAKLQVLLKKKKPSSYTFSYTALCYANIGQEQQAIKVLTRAVHNYPKLPDLWHNLGTLQMQLEDYKSAIASFNTLLALQPNENGSGSIRYNLAFALYHTENFQDALTAILPLFSVGDNTVKKHWWLLRIYCEIGMKEWDSAETSALQLVTLDPNSSSVWSLLGQIAIQKQDYAGAAAYLELATLLKQNNITSHSLTQLYAHQSAWNELVRYQQKLDKPITDQVHSLILSSQYERALNELEKIPEMSMNESFQKGQLLFYLGKNSEAVTELLRVGTLPFKSQEQGNTGVKSKKQKRQRKNRLVSRSLLLAGQILWLDHKWLEARDVFKKLELQSGYESLGKNLASCMQSFLLETKAPIEQPGLYAPPLTMIN